MSDHSSGPLRTVLGHIARALPTLILLAALAGAAWWGHHSGWKLPRFSESVEKSDKADDDWCEEHGVPESQCVECNPALLPRGNDYGWCEMHGVHNCPFEHADVAQFDETPPILDADLERADRALTLLPRPENGKNCKLYTRHIQLASQEAAEKAGVETAEVKRERVVESVWANGEIGYDQTRVARLAARLPGTVWWAPKAVGDEVKAGEVLALVDAADVGKAKAEFIQSSVQCDLKRDAAERTRQAWNRAAASEADLQAADAALREAETRLNAAEQALVNLGLPIRADKLKGLGAGDLRSRLQFLGLPASCTRDLDPMTTTANLLPVVAPLDGVVIAREVVAGEVVDSTKTLFVVADIRQMWLTLSLREEDLRTVKIGHPARFRSDAGGDEMSGTLAWISTTADEKTRLVKARVNLPNPKGDLRANTFGRGRIVLRDEAEAIVVPSDAVHWEGDCFVVFVRDKNYLADGAPKVFHVRTVRVGVRDAKTTEIIAGVLPGECVAAKGSGLLLRELRKDSLDSD